MPNQNNHPGTKDAKTLEFIKKARKVHGEKYDYSKVTYSGAKEKVIIICPKHGEFFNYCTNHLSGVGCPKCAGNIKKTKEEFIEQASKKHNNKFNYKLIEYVNTNTPVTIICPNHGQFSQNPKGHLKSKYGCHKCSGVSKISEEDFFKKCRKKHGNKYDYSKTIFNGIKNKINIICKKHGMFEQTAGAHSRGNDCPKCSGGISYSHDDFIESAQQKWGSKYDYSLTEYKKSTIKVKIICKKHQFAFEQLPGSHLKFEGCPKCSGKYSNTEFFIEKAQNIHKNKYDYSKVRYKNNYTKVIITCSIHGDFKQTPATHLAGKGCSKCSKKYQRTQEEFVEECSKKYPLYDYSKTIYSGIDNLITVICPEHGTFSVQAYNHLHKSTKCPVCQNRYSGRKINTEIFIERANKIYENFYNYSLTEYKSAKSKVKIICPKHGLFLASPDRHLSKNGGGCINCAKEKHKTVSNHKGLESFLKSAKKIHGEKYDYSNVVYNGANEPINITCTIHGNFTQTPSKHINDKRGCPGCNYGFTNQITLNLLKSLPLSLLEPVELLLIIKQAGAFNKLKQSENFKHLLEATDQKRKKEIAKELVAEFEKTKEEEEEILEGEDGDFTTEDLIKFYEEQEAITEEEIVHNFEEQISSKEFVDGIAAFDSNGVSNFLSEETIQFLIKNRVQKAWNKYINGDKTIVSVLKNSKNQGEYFCKIKNEFLNQFEIVKNQKTPDGYNFKIKGKIAKPNEMQKLNSYLLSENQYIINCSGVGSGKSLSGIYASRVLNCKNTLIISFNSTVDEWAKKVKDYFPNTNVYAKGDYDKIKLNANNWNVIILNYESFQQKNSANRLLNMTTNNKFDMVILDEVQLAKQSKEIDEKIKTQTQGFIRRGNIEGTLHEIREKNSNVKILGMSATPVVTNLIEAKKLLELVSGNEYKDLKTNPSIDNALAIHMQLVNNGLRYRPKYDIGVETELLSIDARPILRDIVSIKKGLILDMEEVLLDLKLNSIKHLIRPGVMLYSQYTGDNRLLNKIKDFVNDLGYFCGIYSGSDKTGKNDFTSKKIDVLIGSSSVNTGLDGIQEVCDQIIAISLPWTHAQFEQLVGRIYRQGSKFKKVRITIPMLEIKLSEEKVWSWDRDRYKRIMDRKTLADAAVDGIIPNEKINMTPEQLLKRGQESLKKWIQELENGYDEFDFNRKKIILPLTPNQTEYVKNKFELGDFSKMNKEWSIQSSKTTHKKLNENPEIWYTYHTMMDEKSKSWIEQPYKRIASKIKRVDWIIGDLGCGQNKLRLELPNNKIEAFDHIAIDDSVISCDISKLPAKDEIYDAVVLSLALMGSNYKDYIKEAYRVLKLEQHLYLAEPLKKWEGRIEELVNILEDVGFKCFKPEIGQKFLYLEAVKK